MPRGSDPSVLAIWRERLSRFSRSGLSVREFCEQEEVSAASFYKWRKQLGRPKPRAAFEQVTLAPAAVTIELSNGARISVPGGNLELVRAVVCEVGRQSAAEVEPC